MRQAPMDGPGNPERHQPSKRTKPRPEHRPSRGKERSRTRTGGGSGAIRAGLWVACGLTFIGALVFDTGALIRMPLICATGGCGTYAKWAIWGVATVTIIVVVAAFARQPHSSPGHAPKAAVRRPVAKATPEPIRRRSRPAGAAK